MPRKIKKGLDYFPFDIDLFSDIKIRKLIKCQGAKAIAVYACLLCNIYRDGYYMMWDRALPFVVSESLGVDEAFVGEVIECCVRLDLFDANMFRNKQVLTSRGIQQRYLRELSKLRRAGNVSEYSLLDSPHLAIMKGSTLWLAKMKRDYRLDDDELGDLLDEWSKHVVDQNKHHTSAQEAKRHFEDWYGKRVHLPSPAVIPRETPADKQRGNPPAAKPKPYDHSRLIQEMFSHSYMMANFCRDNGITEAQCRMYAESILNEWQLTGQTHWNLTDARSHMLHTIRIRAQHDKERTQRNGKTREQREQELAAHMMTKIININNNATHNNQQERTGADSVRP